MSKANLEVDSTSYMIDNSVAAAPFIVIAVLGTLGLCIFNISRCLCGACGGRKAVKQYTRGQVKATKRGVLLVTFMTLVGVLLVFGGAQSVGSGITDVTDVGVAATEEMYALAVETNDALAAAGVGRDAGIESDARELRDLMVELRDEVIDGREAQIVGAFVIVALLPVLAIIWSLVGMLASLPRANWGTLWCTAMGGLLVPMAISGLFVMLHGLMNDACLDAELFLDDVADGDYATQRGFEGVLRCYASEVARENVDPTVSNLIESTGELNENPSVRRPVGRPSTASDAMASGKQLAVELELLDRDLENAQSDLENAPPEDKSEGQVAVAIALACVVALRNIDLLYTCHFEESIISDVDEPVCNGIRGGIPYLAAGYGIGGLFLLIGSIWAVQGLKRFNKANQAPSGIMPGDPRLNQPMGPIVPPPGSAGHLNAPLPPFGDFGEPTAGPSEPSGIPPLHPAKAPEVWQEPTTGAASSSGAPLPPLQQSPPMAAASKPGYEEPQKTGGEGKGAGTSAAAGAAVVGGVAAAAALPVATKTSSRPAVGSEHVRAPTCGPIIGQTSEVSVRVWLRGGNEDNGGVLDDSNRDCYGVVQLFEQDPSQATLASTLIHQAAYCPLPKAMDYTGVVDLGGLRQGTRYYYRAAFFWMRTGERPEKLVEAREVPLVSHPHIPVLNFRTVPQRSVSGQGNSCLFFGSTATLGAQQPDAVALPFRAIKSQVLDGEQPDALLLLGDLVSMDTFNASKPEEATARLSERYRGVLGHADVRPILRSIPTYMTVNDREIQQHFRMDLSTDKDSRARFAAAMAAVDNYALAPSGALAAVTSIGADSRTVAQRWYAFTAGQCDVFVLDTRTERHLARGEFISQRQLDALKSWLLTQNDRRVKLIASSSPVAPDLKPSAFQSQNSWDAFPDQRAELLDFIRTSGLRRVAFLGGQLTAGGYARITCTADTSFLVHSFNASPLASKSHLRRAVLAPDGVIGVGKDECEYHSESGPLFSEDNFARVNVHGNEALTFSLFSVATGKTLLEHRVEFASKGQ